MSATFSPGRQEKWGEEPAGTVKFQKKIATWLESAFDRKKRQRSYGTRAAEGKGGERKKGKKTTQCSSLRRR